MSARVRLPGPDEPHGWIDPALLAAEIPGVGAVSSATGLAALLATAVTGVLLTAPTVTEVRSPPA